MSALSSARIWIEATRPKTLTAAIVPIAVGTALVRATGNSPRPLIALLALLSAIFIQIGTNFINDAVDFKKGADNENRIGPRRVTQSGLLSHQTVMWGGLACFAIATALAIPLVVQGGWIIVGIGLLSLVCGYAYTGGPFPLAYRGLGELFVLVFFGIIAVAGIYFLQTDAIIDWRPWLAGTQVGLLATVLIAINNYRDASGDRLVAKRTLAVRFGDRFARIEIAALALLPFALGVIWFQGGYTYAALLPLLSLPLAFKLTSLVFVTEPGPIFNRFLGMSAALH
jgi:1,4-dihydroxy-2-naphthoate octaprenyltransferase